MPSAMRMLTAPSRGGTGRTACLLVVLHAQSPAEAGRFDLGAIAGASAPKLIKPAIPCVRRRRGADSARARQLGGDQGEDGPGQGSSPRSQGKPTQRSGLAAKCAANRPGAGA